MPAKELIPCRHHFFEEKNIDSKSCGGNAGKKGGPGYYCVHYPILWISSFILPISCMIFNCGVGAEKPAYSAAKRSTSSHVGMDGAAPSRETAIAAALAATFIHSALGKPFRKPAIK